MLMRKCARAVLMEIVSRLRYRRLQAAMRVILRERFAGMLAYANIESLKGATFTRGRSLFMM